MKKNKNFIRNCISVLALFIIFFSGYQMVKIYSDYRKSDLLYQNAQNLYAKVIDGNDNPGDFSELQNAGRENEAAEEKTSESNCDIVVEAEANAELNRDIAAEAEANAELSHDFAVEAETAQKHNCSIAVDFEQLQKINKEVVGWIYFENEDISYPVLYSGDDSKYLGIAYTGEKMNAGSIFVSGANNPDFSDRHTIIYGHNMKNSSMFGKLKYYRQQENYYENHKYFQIITPKYSYRYQIFSYREVSADSDVYNVNFANADEFESFVNNVLISDSSTCSTIDLSDESKIITLSTCSGKTTRFIVSAVCIEQFN